MDSSYQSFHLTLREKSDKHTAKNDNQWRPFYSDVGLMVELKDAKAQSSYMHMYIGDMTHCYHFTAS